LIACSLGIEQNIGGIVRFINDAWPQCLKSERLRSAKLVLAGSSPAPMVQELAARMPTIELIPNPSAEDMGRVFSRARVCLSTIESGSGIKIRIAEALRHGKPVIATPHSAMGYERVDPRVVRVSTIPSMTSHIAEIYSHPDPSLLDRLARSEFEDKFSFESGAARLRALVQSIYPRGSDTGASAGSNQGRTS
jgi:glycosyltransferase involved in cell wall biosynthesis